MVVDYALDITISRDIIGGVKKNGLLTACNKFLLHLSYFSNNSNMHCTYKIIFKLMTFGDQLSLISGWGGAVSICKGERGGGRAGRIHGSYWGGAGGIHKSDQECWGAGSICQSEVGGGEKSRQDPWEWLGECGGRLGL